MVEGGDLPPLPPPPGGGPSEVQTARRPNKGGRRRVEIDPSAWGSPPQAGTSCEGVAEDRGGGARRGGAGGGRGRSHRAGGQPHHQQQPLPQQSTPNHPSQAQPQFQFQPQQLQAQFQAILQQLLQRPMFLFKVDKSPARYNTKWGELHPDSQKCLLQIEERILEYRSESQRLDQCSRLCDSSVTNKGFELDATGNIQELRGMSTAMDREKKMVNKMTASVKDMLWGTDLAMRSVMILHHRFPHPSAAFSSNVDIGSQITGATSTFIAQPMAQAYDFYIGIPNRPSPFFIKTVGEFEIHLAECWRWIEESEQLLHLDTKNIFSSWGALLECLPSVLSNIYDYFINTAAKVENLHQYIESLKTAYYADKRRRGDAKRKAAAMRVHPMPHLPAISSWPSDQAAGMFASSVRLGATTIPEGFPESVFSVFSIPLSTSATACASPSLFSTPTSSATTSTLFSSSGVSPQSTPFGSTQPLHRLELVHTSPAFASTPALGGSSPQSSTPSVASEDAMAQVSCPQASQALTEFAHSNAVPLIRCKEIVN